ncbi:MAG TPA: hypothetical protein VFR15_10115 [Chloroflexia bacterium]|nr:hypothetical protein [Chloroflexia bacterium]
MAQIYYPKKTSTKLAEGAIAGLLGGAVTLPVLAIADAAIPERSWWSSISLFGAIFTGVRDFNTASPDMASLIIGVVLVLSLFALAGMGFVNYLVLFRRFKVPAWLGGVLYGVLLGGSILILFNAWWPDVVRQLNTPAILIVFAMGGAVIGWWLSTRPTSERPA